MKYQEQKMCHVRRVNKISPKREATQFTEVKSGINSIIKSDRNHCPSQGFTEYLKSSLRAFVPELKSLPDRKFIVILSYLKLCIEFNFLLALHFFRKTHQKDNFVKTSFIKIF